MIVTKIIGFYTIIDDDYMLVLFDFFFFLNYVEYCVCYMPCNESQFFGRTKDKKKDFGSF